jgi:glycosyltransferase involved in cell wall biosynthesis
METYLADLIAEQRAQGTEATALVHGDPLPEDPVWLVRVPVQGHLAYAPLAAGYPLALHRAIRRFKPDVLHLHMPNNSVFWALLSPAARAIPWVVHWHSDVISSRIRRVLAWAYGLYRPFEQAVLEKADWIVATSPPYLEASEPLSAWRSKCVVIPLGINSTRLATGTLAAAPHDELHHQSSFDARNRLKLLSIGRLAYYKGFETLIRVVALLPNVELQIAGEGELRPALQGLIESLTPNGTASNIRLLGSVSEEEKARLLQACDVFCLPSRERTEAFGMVLLEAMAFAKPCIVTDLPGSGMPWIVECCGSGITVPIDDPAGWRQAIQQIHEAPEQRARMGRAGYTVLPALFSIATNASELLSLYYKSAETPLPPKEKERLLIVIPAKDESQTIGAIVKALLVAGWNDVVVVDDHSEDRTGEIARDAGAMVIRPVLPVGAWGGMQTGIRYALAGGYSGVVTMDADGQHEVHQIPLLLAPRCQFDLVIGAFPDRASHLRRLAWTWFRQIAGFDLRDLTSGFRFYNLDAMRLMTSSEGTLLDYQDLGALLLASRAGLKLHEVPVVMNARTVGHSRVFRNWWGVARYMALTTVLCLSKRPRKRIRTSPDYSKEA